jgi:2,3-bisphosphoglycerate-dependent phosphoglycerate mutase
MLDKIYAAEILSDSQSADVAIPTGIPIVYKFDKHMNSIPPTKEENSVSQVHMNGLFLEKPGLLKEALKREDEWARAVPGYDSTMSRHKRPMSNLERSLYKLEAVRELGSWASEFINLDTELEDDGNDGNFGRPMMLTEDEVWERGMEELESGGQFDPDAPSFHEETADGTSANILTGEDTVPSDAEKVDVPIYTKPCVTSMPSAAVFSNAGDVPIRRDSVIVIIRHGKTQYNKLGLFTGWEDAPLADEGIAEAKLAGQLLKVHGFEFDVVYTSWLSRALETAWYVMDEMDALWLPIIKTWRLNERMYGELTGLSKQMVKQRHGEKQFKAWRRGFDVRPPAVSSFSKDYPGNDSRYQKYLKDTRYSLRESVIRSIEKGQPVLQRKLPKTESLKDCMDRTIPYFKERIARDAVDQGKRVLISSSENAIRGLLMHLCEIPPEEITGLEIPNGLPLIFDIKSKCVKVRFIRVNGGVCSRDDLKTFCHAVWITAFGRWNRSRPIGSLQLWKSS